MGALASNTGHDHIQAADFERISALVGETIGIRLTVQKRLMVESRLRKRFRQIGESSFSAYCRHLFDEGGLEGEMVHIIDAITTNKTDFFREEEHLVLMERQLVPDLLQRRRQERPTLKIWSAASSNGAEAYSIAMILQDMIDRGRFFRYAILGTDISTSVLKTAREAIYPLGAIDPVPPRLAERYILRGRGPDRGDQVRIAPAIRKRVLFERMNLMDESYPYDRDVDIVFLRNVLIYFDKTDQEAVVARLLGHVRPGGYLIVGHSESMIVREGSVSQIASGVFQKQ
ncbi:CheR family methyltransferase [Jiella pelagia]|uniref:Chemotaxis protein methyltransferase n=1 Tax=Jiella pelagia TaxID=2986949 RepID=A0ABY7C4P9_9HYPH|nr:CheR family methyltransferase [Jiella pelagia]WAP69820.1 chemotaxis protein CheR [Jiella pelagia]